MQARRRKPGAALSARLVYEIVQRLEGNLRVPLIQRWAVSLAPVLALFATVAFALLFGAAGLLVATPLAVVLTRLIESLDIRVWPTRRRKRAAGACLSAPASAS